jgi:hypothetical protein
MNPWPGGWYTASVLKHPQSKTADRVIASDPDAAMRRLTEVTRHILAVPKKAMDRSPARERTSKKRRKHS